MNNPPSNEVNRLFAEHAEKLDAKLLAYWQDRAIAAEEALKQALDQHLSIAPCDCEINQTCSECRAK